MSADDENGCGKGSDHDQDRGVPSYPLKSPLRASRSIGEGVSQPTTSSRQPTQGLFPLHLNLIISAPTNIYPIPSYHIYPTTNIAPLPLPLAFTPSTNNYPSSILLSINVFPGRRRESVERGQDPSHHGKLTQQRGWWGW